MPMEVWRPGDYRVCPTCGMRHKVQDIKCTRCKTVLVGAKVHRAAAAPVAVAPAGTRSHRGLRVVVAAGLAVALAAGWWVRSVFRGADLEDQTVAASSTAPVAPQPVQSEWQPPVLSYPPVVGYNTGEPVGLAPLAFQEPTPAPAEPPQTGMMSIAPSSAPLAQTTFTDEDLARRRGQEGGAPVAAVPVTAPAATMATPPPLRTSPDAVPVSRSAAVGMPSAAVAEAASRSVQVPSEEQEEWMSRLRDRQQDVREAEARVRRAEAEAESIRARLSAAADEDDRQDAQKDLSDALDDVEKAERKRSEAQRELDDTRARARGKGVRLER